MTRSARNPALLVVLLSLFIFVAASDPHVVRAAFCGDNLGGVRVPCDCGDVVAADVRLRPTDPIAQHRCPLDGLIVRANPTADSVTLDLGGLAIVGSGHGFGILVERGGSDGAIIVGGPPGIRAEIVGFETGLLSVSSGAIARLERVTFKGNTRHGISIRQAGALLIAVESTQNGEDGMQIIGQGGRLERVVVRANRGNGITADSPGLVVAGRIEDNARHGIVSLGIRSDLRRAIVRGNSGIGVIAGRGQLLDGIQAEWNAMGDVRIRRDLR
ncbi:MAG: right-handed parallel beta-helix repeat-containing protein [Candidatus Dadabacteria bacterium]|nr:MAG: right-handed parallel beta-helix repeat-containing protein [Candidatus Dadabacteria bacterium]